MHFTLVSILIAALAVQASPTPQIQAWCPDGSFCGFPTFFCHDVRKHILYLVAK